MRALAFGSTLSAGCAGGVALPPYDPARDGGDAGQDKLADLGEAMPQERPDERTRNDMGIPERRIDDAPIDPRPEWYVEAGPLPPPDLPRAPA